MGAPQAAAAGGRGLSDAGDAEGADAGAGGAVKIPKDCARAAPRAG